MQARANLSVVLNVLLLAVTLAGCEDPEPIFVDAGIDAMPDADLTAPETALTVTPAALSNQAIARFEFSGGAAAGFRCKLDDGVEAACTSPFEMTVAEGEHRFEVAALSAAGVVDVTPASHTWRVDLTPPDTTITEGPGALDNSVAVTFEFAAQEDVTSTCATDGAAAVACTSPHRVTGLTDGAHTFVVTATDLAGNVEAVPARHAWTVDTRAPDTTIDTGPTGAVAQTAATFSFSSPDAGAGATFECGLDGAAFAACTSPRALTGLAQGAHTFLVRVRDATGNLDPSPARRQWTVDTVAPTATITSGPTGPTNDSTPTFGFTTAGTPTVIQCRVYAGAPAGTFAACTTTFTPAALTDGAYTFEVRVADAASNASSATRAFSVDTAPPTVAITGGPAGPTGDSTPTFTFTTGGAPTATECRVGGAFVACSGSYTPAALADAAHTFEVRVTDAAGNSASATRAFSVDTQGPTATITGGPNGATNDSTPTFTFTTAGAPTTTQCRVGTGAFVACSASYTPAALADAAHTFEVRVSDTAGNAGSATRSFTVDTQGPTVTITAGPTGPTNDSTPTFTFTTAGAPTTTQCRVGTGALVACNGTYTPAALADAAHTFEVRVSDAAGNAGSATRGFSVDTQAPTVTITGGPNGLTNDNTPTFTFTTGGAPTATQCRIGAAAFVACSGTYTPAALGDAAHTFEVRVSDAAGNAASATRSFSIDSQGPTVTITGGPGGPQGGWTNDNTPTFTFTTGGAPTSIQCRINTGAAVACTTAFTSAALADSPNYTFFVVATDAAGNQTTASRPFWVDATPPNVEITAGADSSLAGSFESFTFTHSSPGAPVSRVECRHFPLGQAPSGAFVSCSSPVQWQMPRPPQCCGAEWTFEVRVIDAAGNERSAFWNFGTFIIG